MPVASQSIARIFEERKADKIAHANLLLSLSIMESIKLRRDDLLPRSTCAVCTCLDCG